MPPAAAPPALNLTPAQLAAFERDGYVHGGRLLDDAQVDALRRELDRLIALHDRGTEDRVYIGDTAAFCQRRDCFLQFTNIHEVSEPFDRVARDRRLVGAAAGLLGAAPLRLFADQVLFKNGRDKAFNNWHQDGPAFDILREPAELTAWVALDDVAAGDGPVCFATGSHRWDEAPAAANARLRDMQARGDAGLHSNLIRRGEVHFHHGLTWHCSLANRSGRPRRGLAIHYVPADARYRAAGGHYFKAFVEVADGEPLAGRHFPLMAP